MLMFGSTLGPSRRAITGWYFKVLATLARIQELQNQPRISIPYDMATTSDKQLLSILETSL
jgi:hypothetical protein